MGCCNIRNGLIVGAVLGALVAILGGILIPVGQNIIRGTVEKEAVIENGTTAYDNWVSAAATVYRQFWFFEVTNPSEVLDGQPPRVVERGPYTYKTRFLPKENITNNENHTISYILPNGAIFERSKSAGSEEDTIVSINLAVVGAYSVLAETTPNVLEWMIKKSKSTLFQNRTVKELLWGYRDPMLKTNVGLFAPYNGTYDGYYNVYTGKDDISKVAQIESWRGTKNLSFWGDEYCDMINGTDASSFSPFVDKKKPLYFFSSDICRSVSASFQESVDLLGIKLYRFTLLANTLADPTVNPDNQCYCKKPEITRNCTTAGVLDVSTCQGGKPVFISLPHFLHGSQYLRENVLGLNPSEEHHITYLDVEPITGFTLRFAKRLQVNMMYGPSKNITLFKNIKDHTMLPVVWLNESAAADEATADMFKAKVIANIRMLGILQLSLLVIGLTVFVLCLISYFLVKCRANQSKLA